MFGWGGGQQDAATDGKDANPNAGKKKRRPLKYIVGRDSHAVQAAERIPVVNNMVTAIHKVMGHTEQEKRAKEMNPMGTNGLITQTAECVPGISDVVRCIHQFRGEDEAAERARGYSLGKYLSKDGAITRAAELLPGSNLVAAAILETSGNHEEAKRSLNLIRNWREAGSADGALTKLAEMFPGTDLIAFGLHTSQGNFAHALRSIVKTRWVDIDITGQSCIIARVDCVASLGLETLNIGDVNVHPISGPLVGALLDLAFKLIENAKGGPQLDIKIVVGDMSATIVQTVNSTLAKNLREQLTTLDQKIEKWLADAKEVLAKKRKSRLMRYVLPSQIPAPPESVIEMIQQAVPRVKIYHGILPYVRHHRPKYAAYKRGMPEVVAATSCLSCAGCLAFGTHTCMFGCFTACLAGLSQGLRELSVRLIPMLNKRNASAWDDFRKCKNIQAPQAKTRRARRSASKIDEVTSPIAKAEPAFDAETAERPVGVVVEVLNVPEIVNELVDYVVDDVLASWPFGKLIARFLEGAVPALAAYVADLFVSKAAGHMQVFVQAAVPQISALRAGKQTLELPSMPFGVLVDLRLDKDGPMIERIRVVMADNIINHTFDCINAQLPNFDLRNLDTKFSTFTEPINLNVVLGMSWLSRSRLQVTLDGVTTKLGLPA